jgi:hypothetical protein
MSNGLLGKAMSQTNTNVTVYTVPNNVQFATININILNQGVAGTVKVAITTSASPAAVDYIDSAAALPADGGVYERTCQILSPGEKVIVEASNSNMSIRVQGLEQL